MLTWGHWFFFLRHPPFFGENGGWRKWGGGYFLEKLGGGEKGGGVKIFDWAGVAKMGVALNFWPWPDESMQK